MSNNQFVHEHLSMQSFGFDAAYFDRVAQAPDMTTSYLRHWATPDAPVPMGGPGYPTDSFLPTANTVHLHVISAGSYSWASDILSGVASGVIGGLIISATLWLIHHFSKPKFEYFDVGDGLGHFFYNRYRPIVVGGSSVICGGPVMYERTPRAGSGGFYMGPKHSQVFATCRGKDTQFALRPGETIDISYRYAPVRYWWSRSKREEAWELQIDPFEVMSSRTSASDNSVKKTVKGWKLGRVVLQPSATKTA